MISLINKTAIADSRLTRLLLDNLIITQGPLLSSTSENDAHIRKIVCVCFRLIESILKFKFLQRNESSTTLMDDFVNDQQTSKLLHE